MMLQGQNSQVWEASQIGNGRHFAIKVLLPDKAKISAIRGGLYHEAKVGMQFEHPNVIRTVELIKGAEPYIIMDYFPSTNLKLRLLYKHDLIKEKAHSIIEQAAKGLYHIHEQGWLHRDVKPDNILINSSGDVRIIDFGLARPIRNSFLSRLLWGMARKLPFKWTTQGTRSYMSPEQIRNDVLDERADIYSFGMTIFEMIAGRPPFRGDSPAQILQKQLYENPMPPKNYNTNITDEFNNFVMKMISKDPEERPRDFGDFLSKFRDLKIFKVDPVKK
jgi:serine/threonine protein kinase